MATLFAQPLTLLPHHLSASERSINSTTKPNFNLQLTHPILARLERCTDMHQLRQLHAQMITAGLIHDPFAGSRLIAFCALSLQGELNYALALFAQIQTPNLFIWNAMIRAFSRTNHPHLSLHFYIQMLLSGCISPDTYTFPFLFKSCSHLSASSEGQQIHAHVVKFGLECDPFVSNSLIHLYAELGLFGQAKMVFERMAESERSEVSLAAMIAGFVNNGRPRDAIDLFCSKDWRKSSFDQITAATVLSACARVGDLELGKEIHCYIGEKGIELSLILCNSLINMYAKCGQLEIARCLFESMPEKDSVSWNVLISGFVENGHLEKGLELLYEMKVKNIRANEATFLTLVSACADLEVGKTIHGHIIDLGFESSTPICNALIDMYSRIGHVEIGREVFEGIPNRDIITWNSMIAGYARSGSMEIARSLFSRMPEKDNFSWSTMVCGYVRNGRSKEAMRVYEELLAEGRTRPDTVTIISVLTACADLGALEEGRALHLSIKNSAIEVDVTLGTALIDMYSKCGCLKNALEVFTSMTERDVLTWTALISGLAMNGRGKEAIEVFEEMQSEQTRPNSVTFLCVLSACSHAGLVEDGRRVYSSMLKDYGIEPEMAHLGCMVDLLGRAGLLDEALQFIRESAAYEVLNASVWGALLGACRIHGNVEYGEIAAKKMIELDADHQGAHVLMSNIYAEAGRWDEKKDMRRKMRDENITKEVGKSWIVLNGTIHEFASGGDVGG